MESKTYPEIEINLGKLRHNIEEALKNWGTSKGIDIVAIIKGFHAVPEAVQ